MKAYTGFKMATTKNPTFISTGFWGCGAFGGDIVHKFLQQLLAVSIIPNARLYYSTYGNSDIAIKLNQILDIINKKEITIKHLYDNLMIGDKLGF
jgi:poly(ADP-ribose) glycohydrolase